MGQQSLYPKSNDVTSYTPLCLPYTCKTPSTSSGNLMDQKHLVRSLVPKCPRVFVFRPM